MNCTRSTCIHQRNDGIALRTRHCWLPTITCVAEIMLTPWPFALLGMNLVMTNGVSRDCSNVVRKNFELYHDVAWLFQQVLLANVCYVICFSVWRYFFRSVIITCFVVHGIMKLIQIITGRDCTDTRAVLVRCGYNHSLEGWAHLLRGNCYSANTTKFPTIDTTSSPLTTPMTCFQRQDFRCQ